MSLRQQSFQASALLNSPSRGFRLRPILPLAIHVIPHVWFVFRTKCRTADRNLIASGLVRLVEFPLHGAVVDLGTER